MNSSSQTEQWISCITQVSTQPSIELVLGAPFMRLRQLKSELQIMQRSKMHGVLSSWWVAWVQGQLIFNQFWCVITTTYCLSFLNSNAQGPIAWTGILVVAKVNAGITFNLYYSCCISKILTTVQEVINIAAISVTLH